MRGLKKVTFFREKAKVIFFSKQKKTLFFRWCLKKDKSRWGAPFSLQYQVIPLELIDFELCKNVNEIKAFIQKASSFNEELCQCLSATWFCSGILQQSIPGCYNFMCILVWWSRLSLLNIWKQDCQTLKDVIFQIRSQHKMKTSSTLCPMPTLPGSIFIFYAAPAIHTSPNATCN